jgi:cytochrome c oxidase subunit II
MQQTVARPRASELRSDERVIHISASDFAFKPSEILVRKGAPVTLELISQDRRHGFKLPEFHLQADMMPGVPMKVRFLPDKVGKFTFICDVFCGEGHEGMLGTLRVVEQ